MENYICNPLNVDYRFQFHAPANKGEIGQIAREAADPSMILFQGTYYLFASMTLEVWTSKDLANWEQHRLPEYLPLYDYAPDVRVVGEYVYFSASKRGEICDFYRTKDVLNGPYEKIEGTFDFWDPNLFADDDGNIYFYWGCNNMTPIWGVQLDPDTMRPLTEPKELIWGNPEQFGFERCGEDNSLKPYTLEEVEETFQEMLKAQGKTEEDLPQEVRGFARAILTNRPFIEGAWMTKHNGIYYLQYACPGTEFNTYADGVYEGKHPLGPFAPAKNNPFSMKPGGFIPGAGHGSTMEDIYGNFWHTATMRISKNHNFERRVGLWQAGFDEDNVMFCNQRYGDWPMRIGKGTRDIWANPEWYLLSYRRKMTASSFEEGKGPELAADENVQTWWRAASNKAGEWLQMDLGEVQSVHAVQINFADDIIALPSPKETSSGVHGRYIDEAQHVTRWKLEGSTDGTDYFMLADKTQAETNLPHDLIVMEEGRKIRFLKLTVYETPYQQQACISGLRVFGVGNGEGPSAPEYTVQRTGALSMQVSMESQPETVGYSIQWGFAPDKLYHSRMTFENVQEIAALAEGQTVYMRVDAFNENGITEGKKIVEV